MGLDAVDIVLRAEEFYSTTFTDHEAAQVRSVGDFYRLICFKLKLIPLAQPQIPETLPAVAEHERTFFILQKRTPLPPPPAVLPWTPRSVWDTLVAILVDQQSLKVHDIPYTARFVEDLGVD